MMDRGDLLERLESAASEAESDEETLFLDAAAVIREQQERIETIQQELAETNEGMMALTLELEAAERRYRSLFEDAAEGIYKTTAEIDAYQMVNQSMADILGYDDPEEIEMAVSLADVFVDPDRLSEYQSQLQQHEEIEDFEYRIRRADGTVRWVSDNVRRIDDDNGRSFRGGVIDITERKEYERRLEERNEALEALNRIVRHDIGNDVQVISTWAETLAASEECDSHDAIERIRQQAADITSITREAGVVVDALTGGEELSLDSVLLDSSLRSELESQREAHPDAEFELLDTIPYVQLQANEMLDSVFRNLLSNAVTHNDTDQPVVEISCTDRGEDLLIQVADNGPGIPDDQKEDIFGKGAQSVDSDGTGIGLYLVDYLVTQYGGDVWVTDNEPSGAVFNLTLPKA